MVRYFVKFSKMAPAFRRSNTNKSCSFCISLSIDRFYSSIAMVSDDPRRIVGRRVYAKAIHVTALSECARRFGSRSKTKEVAGTVLECIDRKTKTNRSSTYVKAVYTLGNGTLKTVELNIRSGFEGGERCSRFCT